MCRTQLDSHAERISNGGFHTRTTPNTCAVCMDECRWRTQIKGVGSGVVCATIILRSYNVDAECASDAQAEYMAFGWAMCMPFGPSQVEERYHARERGLCHCDTVRVFAYLCTRNGRNGRNGGKYTQILYGIWYTYRLAFGALDAFSLHALRAGLSVCAHSGRDESDFSLGNRRNGPRRRKSYSQRNSLSASK